jgi:hypothetical protein
MTRVGDVWRCEIIIGGKPVEALSAALTDGEIVTLQATRLV